MNASERGDHDASVDSGARPSCITSPSLSGLTISGRFHCAPGHLGRGSHLGQLAPAGADDHDQPDEEWQLRATRRRSCHQPGCVPRDGGQVRRVLSHPLPLDGELERTPQNGVNLQDRRCLKRPAPIRTAPVVTLVIRLVLVCAPRAAEPPVIDKTLTPAAQPPAAPQSHVQPVQDVNPPLHLPRVPSTGRTKRLGRARTHDRRIMRTPIRFASFAACCARTSLQLRQVPG
jgi:hypothetical protein